MAEQSNSIHLKKDLSCSKIMQCTLVLGSEDNKKEFVCNKKQLADSSIVFHAMFFGPWEEKEEKIYIPDVEPELFNYVIQFIKTGHVIIESTEKAFQLLYVTKKYLLTDLKLQCFKRICRDLNIHNVCNFYEVATQFDETELSEHFLEFIRLEASNIFQDPSIMDISKATLMKIVEQDNLNVSSELQVINACLRWAKNEAHKQNLPCDFSGTRIVLGPVFPMLRFLSLTPTQFAEGPAKSDLLTCEEGYSILLNKLSRFESNQLPQYISKEKTPRKYLCKQSPYYGTVYKDFLYVLALNDTTDSDSTTVEYLDYYHSFEPDVHILRFTVDRDILLLGFQVATQFNMTVFNQIVNKATYREDVSAVIYVDESDVASASFKGYINYNNLLTLKFKQPVKVSKDIEQEVLLEFCNSGNYNSVKYTSRLKRNSIGNVNFNLDQKNSDGMVYSILFTC